MAGRGIRGLIWSYLGLCCTVGLPALAANEECHPSLETAVDKGIKGPHLFFPQTHLFLPLLADPKEPRFFLGYREAKRTDGDWRIGVVGFGETFPLYRLMGGCAADGWQVDIAGGGIARFDLDDDDRDGIDMIDADYLFAVPLSWRRGNWAFRTRIFHESAHLGETPRIDAAIRARRKSSIDSIDLIASYSEAKWRVYGGAEYVIHHHPEIEPWGVHLGAEYYGPRRYFGGTASWIAGIDGKAWEEYDYDTDLSIKAGLSFGGRYLWQHHLQIVLEWYDGHANSGVFYEEKLRYLGAGVYFGF